VNALRESEGIILNFKPEPIDIDLSDDIIDLTGDGDETFPGEMGNSNQQSSPSAQRPIAGPSRLQSRESFGGSPLSPLPDLPTLHQRLPLPRNIHSKRKAGEISGEADQPETTATERPPSKRRDLGGEKNTDV